MTLIEGQSGIREILIYLKFDDLISWMSLIQGQPGIFHFNPDFGCFQWGRFFSFPPLLIAPETL